MPSFLSKFPIINIIFSTNYRHYNQIIMNIIPRTISTHQHSFSITHIIMCTSPNNMEAFSQPDATVRSLSSCIQHFSLAFHLLFKITPLPFPSHSAPPNGFPFIFLSLICYFLLIGKTTNIQIFNFHHLFLPNKHRTITKNLVVRPHH